VSSKGSVDSLLKKYAFSGFRVIIIAFLSFSCQVIFKTLTGLHSKLKKREK